MRGSKCTTTGKKNRHSTLIAGLILVIVLAAVAAFASPTAVPRGEICRVANAIPATSVFFVDVSNPVAQIDRLADMGLLPDAAGFLAVVGERSGLPSLEELAATLESWDADPGLRSDLESIAGRRAAIVLVSSQGPLPLLALRGSGGADVVGALESLAVRLGLETVVAAGSTTATESFMITDATGHQVMHGRAAGDWTVLGAPGTGEVAAELAVCLAGWGPCPDRPLATLPEFERTLAQLPEEAPIHGFLNVPQLRAILESESEPAMASLLDTTDGIAFARKITADGIESWATGRFVTTKIDDAQSRLLAQLSPIGQPLTNRFPDNALATYDLGASAADTAGVLTRHLETLLPSIHARIRDILDEFRAATGLDPELDLLPFLGRGIAVGILPAEEQFDGWPLPRPVLLVRSTDDRAVRRFSEAWLRWEAGALAPLTQGLFSASLNSSQFAGTELWGLQVDSVMAMPMPLPSPTLAVVNGLVIASPVRSAVEEILDIRSSDGTPATASLSRTGAVETMWLNLPAWPEAWRRAEIFLTMPVFELVLDPEPVIDIARSLMRLLGGFDPAQGSTTVTADGEFTFHMAVTRNSDTTVGQR